MKKITVAILLVTAASFLISCGSKPVEEPEETPTAPVVEVEEETEVEEEIPVVEEVQEEIQPVDNTSAIESVDDARYEAVEAGAEEKAADILSKLDAEFDVLKNSDTDVSDAAQILAEKYKVLLDYLKALEAKEIIDENGYASYDQNAYDQGVEAFEGLKDALLADGPLSADVSEKAQKAYASFNTVLIAAYKKLARAERDAAYKEKLNADSVKAGVSQKEKYSKAVQSFQIGDSCYSMQNAERAIVYYQEAKEVFAELYKDVSEKRAAAQAAIEAAKKRVEESANYAEEADSKSPVTKQIDGIEDEDAVLLEEDEYEDPEEAEVEIAAKLDGEEYDEEDTEEDLIVESIIFDDEEEDEEYAVVEETEAESEELEAEDEESSDEEDVEEALEEDSDDEEDAEAEDEEDETSEDEADDEEDSEEEEE